MGRYRKIVKPYSVKSFFWWQIQAIRNLLFRDSCCFARLAGGQNGCKASPCGKKGQCVPIRDQVCGFPGMTEPTPTHLPPPPPTPPCRHCPESCTHRQCWVRGGGGILSLLRRKCSSKLPLLHNFLCLKCRDENSALGVQVERKMAARWRPERQQVCVCVWHHSPRIPAYLQLDRNFHREHMFRVLCTVLSAPVLSRNSMEQLFSSA
jgi:hypothetical protein